MQKRTLGGLADADRQTIRPVSEVLAGVRGGIREGARTAAALLGRGEDSPGMGLFRIARRDGAGRRGLHKVELREDQVRER